MARKWKFVKWKYFSSRNNFNLRLSKSKKNIFFKPAADSNHPVSSKKPTFDSLLLISPRFGGSDAVGEFFKLEKSVFYVENFDRKYLTELENCKINGIRIKNGTENNCGTLPMVIQTFEHFSLEEIDLNRTKILYVIRDPRYVEKNRFNWKRKWRSENLNWCCFSFMPGNAICFPKTPKQTLSFYLGKSRSIFVPQISWFINMNFGTIFSVNNFFEMIREKKRKAWPSPPNIAIEKNEFKIWRLTSRQKVVWR